MDDDKDTSTLKALTKEIIPNLSNSNHKGSLGKIGIIGGCREYTGAPYFAAISSLKLGADLVYIFCTSDASTAIKSYSPESIVIPILDSENLIDELMLYLSKLDAVVIGPGLGRSKFVSSKICIIVDKVIQLNALLILDADSLFFFKNYQNIVYGYSKAILTPNKYEFCRLYKDLTGKDLLLTYNHKPALQELCQKLLGPTIVRKGEIDLICDNQKLVTCSEIGSFRRCGGQGDILAGVMSTFGFWSHKAYFEEPEKFSSKGYNPALLAAFAACTFTRRCNRLTFERLGRTATASDMIKQISNTFIDLFSDKFKS